jgi:hypothetical protein
MTEIGIALMVVSAIVLVLRLNYLQQLDLADRSPNSD